jgi:hypothetical protein
VAKSRSRQKPRAQTAKPRWEWRRAAGGWAEFIRNLALLFLGAPFVEPLLSGAPLDGGRAFFGLGVGIALLVASSILDHERRD